MTNNSNTSTIEGTTPVDGRTARRDRNKVAVLDSVIELFVEGKLTPGVHEVASRSGVSLRSVYRYFTDVDDLVSAAIERHIERTSHLFDIPDVGIGPTCERIDRFSDRRVTLFLTVWPVYHAAVVRASDQQFLADSIEGSRARLGDQTAAMFAPELGAMPAERAATVSAMLDTLSQLDALDHVHRTRGCDPAATADFLRRSFTEILV